MKKSAIIAAALTIGAVAGISYKIFDKAKTSACDSVIIDGVTEKPSDALRIITFNLRYNDDPAGSVADRSKIVEAIIRQCSPDSFGVQEATGKWMKILGKRLGDQYDFVACPRDNSAYKSERNAVFYRKDKYSLIDSGTIWLSETPEKKYTKSFGSSCARIATWAVLRDKASGNAYTHLNTHLDHKSENARVNQCGILLNKISELSQSTKVICTGDFNADNSSSVYKAMTECVCDTRIRAIDSDEGMTFHNYGKFDEYFDGAIDYIFVPEGTKVYTHKIIRNTANGMYPSDHFPVVSDFSLY